MDWILRSPQMHSSFGSLGFNLRDGYHASDDCNDVLESILHHTLTENKYLRTYRRSISFGQNIQKDLIPLLIHTKDEKTVELIIKILVNLTIPIECLISMDSVTKTDFGRHTIFEINNLLTSSKIAFTDLKVAKVFIDYLKKNVDLEQSAPLTDAQCANISDGLLLLRNVLHIPEEPGGAVVPHSVQNQILWNLFSHSIDKILIKLMTIPEATHWGVSMVQLIALLYKDQHAGKLQKLLQQWQETSLSDSSEDNESNTSPSDYGGRGDSSPMLTSDPISDLSDTGVGGNNSGGNSNGGNSNGGDGTAGSGSVWHTPRPPPPPAPPPRPAPPPPAPPADDFMTPAQPASTAGKRKLTTQTQDKPPAPAENSDCGYSTQRDNPGTLSLSTSSNEEEQPRKQHKKPTNAKQRPGPKPRVLAPHERKRKKIAKRARVNITNVQGLSRATPSDDDISQVLKNFTVDFLLKGYNSLVKTLHAQILTNQQLEIDTSHFFWLMTYFLKMATQIELDLEHVGSVLSCDVISYLVVEGVNLCEQFELAVKLDPAALKPRMRRLHLVVTAIREFVQAVEVYKKIPLPSAESRGALAALAHHMCDMRELRALMLLLLRHYNPHYHSKQYLQDLVVTNHILLLFVDSVVRSPDYGGSTSMLDHIKQFASTEMMHQYALLLEDYADNGEFVNDCVFTMMHHVGGDAESIISLFQPKMLKIICSMRKTGFDLCDDWSDLLEFVMNTFVKRPSALYCKMDALGALAESESGRRSPTGPPSVATVAPSVATVIEDVDDREWTECELSSLSWCYMQCSGARDVLGELVRALREEGSERGRGAVLRQLRRHALISDDQHAAFSRAEAARGPHRESLEDDIGHLCEQLIRDGRLRALQWLQQALLDACYANICVQQRAGAAPLGDLFTRHDHLLSPVAYHSLITKKSVPLVPWNFWQAEHCRDLRFLQLLHKLGLHMPVDTGRVFISVPHFWTSDFLYDVAARLLPIDTAKLPSSRSQLPGESSEPPHARPYSPPGAFPPPTNFYQILKTNHFATMCSYTPICNRDPRVANASLLPATVPVTLVPAAVPLVAGAVPLVRGGGVTLLPVAGEPASAALPLLASAGVAHGRVSLLAPGGGGLLLATGLPSEREAPLIDDDNYSDIETASVASHLTRMYVSDEEDRPDHPMHERARGHPF